MSTEPGVDIVTYTYRPSLLGTPWEFKLTGNAIEWRAGRQSGRTALSRVHSVRLSYRPANMQSQRFVTELWADGAPKLQIVSASWKSMFDQERLDEPYSAFIAELHRRLVQAGATPQFIRGRNKAIYWTSVAVFTAVALGLSILIVRGLQAGVFAGAAFVGAFLALFMWQGGDFLRRNQPGVYRPDALPPGLLPKP
jgi:hypothetical protein